MLAFGRYGKGNEGPAGTYTDIQVEPIVVAYCTKPRNDARLIPDGTIQSAHVSWYFSVMLGSRTIRALNGV